MVPYAAMFAKWPRRFSSSPSRGYPLVHLPGLVSRPVGSCQWFHMSGCWGSCVFGPTPSPHALEARARPKPDNVLFFFVQPFLDSSFSGPRKALAFGFLPGKLDGLNRHIFWDWRLGEGVCVGSLFSLHRAGANARRAGDASDAGDAGDAGNAGDACDDAEVMHR